MMKLLKTAQKWKYETTQFTSFKQSVKASGSFKKIYCNFKTGHGIKDKHGNNPMVSLKTITTMVHVNKTMDHKQ
jgi:hypothetical protein